VIFPKVNRRIAVSAASTGAAGLTAAATFLAMSPAPVSAGTTPTSATGITSTGLNLPPLEAVTSNGPLQDQSLITIPANPLLSGKILHETADGTLGKARSSVADLDLGQGKLIASLLTASCTPGGGKSDIVHAVLAGHDLPVSAPPNTTITVPPKSPIKTGLPSAPQIAAITLNKQVKNSDGGMTVTALEVVLGPAGQQKTIDISTAHCAALAAHTAPSSPAAPPAPAPTPHHGTLPVTG
jgi:hypothetical protein